VELRHRSQFEGKTGRKQQGEHRFLSALVWLSHYAYEHFSGLCLEFVSAKHFCPEAGFSDSLRLSALLQPSWQNHAAA